VNEWGWFLSWKKQIPFRNIPAPRGPAAKQIRKAYYRKHPGGLKAKRLSIEELQSKRVSFTATEYAWLIATVAFGLRPEEASRCFEDGEYHRWNDKALYAFQFKLQDAGYEPNECWKSIPIKMPFQAEAKVILTSTKPTRPTRAKLKKVLGQGRYYMGRRWCARWARKKFGEFKAMRWLGHRDVNTLRRHYDESDAPPEAA
jgi:hypothetical protein